MSDIAKELVNWHLVSKIEAAYDHGMSWDLDDICKTYEIDKTKHIVSLYVGKWAELHIELNDEGLQAIKDNKALSARKYKEILESNSTRGSSFKNNYEFYKRKAVLEAEASLNNDWKDLIQDIKSKVDMIKRFRERNPIDPNKKIKTKPINRSSLKIVPVKTLEKEIKQQKEGDNEKKNTKKVSVDRRTRNGLEREFKNTYKKTIYRALNIPNKSNPSPDELKKLCRKLQLKNHPDKQGGSKERIQEINDACKIIDITYKKK